MATATMEIIMAGDMDVIFDGADEKSIVTLCVNIARDAKTGAPFDEGVLRNSIMWKTTKEEGGFNDSGDKQAEYKITARPAKLNGVVGFNLPYGIYQEFGTRYMAPHPFLRPAIALNKGQKLEDVIKKTHNEWLRGKLKPGQKRETFF